MTNLVTTKHKLHTARQIEESITEPANTAYYLFLGDHMPHDDSTLAELFDKPATTVIDCYKQMIQGKRVSSNDVAVMVRNIPWTANTVYDMHDDQDDDLSTKDFYVVVNASSYYHVYKCLDNNMEAASTIEPDFSHIVGANTILYQTSDGYRWKYLYTVSSANNLKFSTSEYFPVFPNTSVSANAVDGAIDIIKIEGEGEGYDNYFEGAFSTEDLRVDGNNQVYAIVNSSASLVNGFYSGCLIYISAGTGAGQARTVEDYFVNADGKYVVINNAFTTAPDATDEYEVYPRIEIVADGGQTTNTIARALINASSSNSVYRIEVLERGRGYIYANAAVVANDVVQVTEDATLRAIFSPGRGHGFDVAKELYANKLMFSVKFNNSESNTILTTNQFQQIGLLRDPLFANVNFEINSANGTFTPFEQIFKLNPIRIDFAATINTTSANLNSNTGDFTQQVAVGTYVYLTTAEGAFHMLTTVASVTNSSRIVLASNGYFACTNTVVYLANVSSNAYLSDIVDASNIKMTNVAGVWAVDDLFVGITSGAKAVVNSLARSGVTKGFDTFIQLYKYDATLVSGTFTENEKVYQTSIDTANADLFTVIDDGGALKVYTSNQIGTFAITGIVNTITGNTSGAIAALSERYNPELVFASGDVLYMENISPVEREDDQTETFKIVLDF